MNIPLKTQSEILEKHKEENSANHKRYTELILQGHTVIMEGGITGPYTEHKTYFMSNGESISIIGPASLGWAINIPTIWLY